MGEFGWAYVKGALTASGPTGSIQFRDDANDDGDAGLTGSANFTFVTGTIVDDPNGPYELRLTGTMSIRDGAFNLYNTNTVMEGDLTVEGNLTVTGDQTIISSSTYIVQDPLIGLGFGTASAHTGAAGDRGLVLGIKDNLNQALFWDNSSGSFIAGKVAGQSPTTLALDVPEGNLSTLKLGQLLVSGSWSNDSLIGEGHGAIHGYSITTSGQIRASGNVLVKQDLEVDQDVRITGAVSAAGGLGGHIFVGQVSITDNVLITGSVQTELGTLSGSKGIFSAGLTSSAEILASGNIRTALGDFSGSGLVVSKNVQAQYGTISGSKGIFTTGLTSSAEILASGNIRTNLGSLSGTNVIASGHVLAPYGSFSGSAGIFSGPGIQSVGNIKTSASFSGSGGVITGQLQVAGPFHVSGPVLIGHGESPTNGPSHQVTGAIFLTSSTVSKFSGSLSSSGEIFANSFRSSGDIETSGNLTIGRYIIHEGDADTSLEFTTDKIAIKAGGREFIEMTEASSDTIEFNRLQSANFNFIVNASSMEMLSITNGGMVINEEGMPAGDLRMETNRKQRAIYVDSDLEYVNILVDLDHVPHQTGSDTALFVSGAFESIDTGVQGTSVFGGDVVLSGSTRIGRGLAPIAASYHQVTGALYVTSSQANKFSGSVSSSGEVYAFSGLRTSGDVLSSGSIKTELGTISGSKGIFVAGLTSSAEILASGNIRTALGDFSGSGLIVSKDVQAQYGTISGSKGIFVTGLTSSAEILASGNIRTLLGTISGSKLIITDDAQFADDIATSGSIIFNDGGSLKEAGGTAAFTFDASGHVTKIGQDSPSSGQFLKWDGSKAVWDNASVTIDNDGDNRVTTAKGDGDFNAEANLTFDGTELRVIGRITGSSVKAEQDIEATGSISGSKGIFTLGLTSSAEIIATGNIRTALGTISGTTLVASGDVKTQYGTVSGSTAIFTDEVQVAGYGTISLKVSGSARVDQTLEVGQDLLLTGAVSAAAGNNMFVGQVSVASDVLVTGSIKTELGTISGSKGIFTEEVQFADDIKVSGSAIFNASGDEETFTIQGDNDTRLFYVRAEDDAIRIGAGTQDPAAVVDIYGDTGQAKSTLVVQHYDVDKTAVRFSGSNTTMPIVDVQGYDVTESALMALSASALTTGQVIEIDLNDASTTTNGPTGIYIDVKKTGNKGGGTNSAYKALEIEMDDTGTNNGFAQVTKMAISASVHSVNDAGAANTNIGAVLSASGGKNNFGLRTFTDNAPGSADIQMVSSTDDDDYAFLSVGNDGLLTIGTVNDSAADGNIVLTADGHISASADDGDGTVTFQGASIINSGSITAMSGADKKVLELDYSNAGDQAHQQSFGGLLKARQMFITQHNYNNGGTTTRFLPFQGAAEQTTADHQTLLLTPFTGRLRKMICFSGNNVTAEMKFAFHTGSEDGNFIGGGPFPASAAGYVDAECKAQFSGTFSAQRKVLSFDFTHPPGDGDGQAPYYTGSTTFASGSTVGISCTPGAAPGDIQITCVWEYDLFDEFGVFIPADD